MTLATRRCIPYTHNMNFLEWIGAGIGVWLLLSLLFLFLFLYNAGKNKSDVTREARVERVIDKWHHSPDSETRELHEYLGWDWADYKVYVESGVLPPQREGAF